MKKILTSLLTCVLFSGHSLYAQVEFSPVDVLINDTSAMPVHGDLYEVAHQAFGDFDNDGDGDVVAIGNRVRGNRQSYLWFLENNGGMSFDRKTDSFQLETFASPLVADFDQDGNVDIFVARHYYTTSALNRNILLLNTGNFVFNPDTITALDSINVAFWKTLHANNDNYPDIVINGKLRGSSDGYTVLFLNDGTGHFTSAGINLGIHRNSGIGIIDVNGDGLDEIILTGRDAALNLTNHVLINQGNGSFTTTTFNTGLAFYGPKIFTHDFDRDGHPDFAVDFSDGLARIRVYINNYPAAGFTANSSILGTSLQGYSTHVHTAVDVDNNGKLDFLNWQTNGPSLPRIRRFTPDNAGIYSVNSTPLGDIKDITDVDTFDIDGDGYTDLFDRKSEAVYYNNHAGGFIYPNQYRTFSMAIRDFRVLDFNNDGYDDFSLCTPIPNTNGIYINRGGSGFDRWSIPFFNQTHIHSIICRDIDADGDSDFVGRYNNSVYILENQGGNYVELSTSISTNGKVFVMNYDNQHKLDILVLKDDPSNYSRDKVFIYASDASGNWNLATISGLPTVDSRSGFTVGDQDGDGLDDVYIGYPDPWQYQYGTFLNNGNGAFTAQTGHMTAANSAQNTEVIMMDIIGDSDKEILAGEFGNIYGKLGYFEYDSTSQGLCHVAPGIDECPTFDVADFNGDQQIDGVAFESSTQMLKYFFTLPDGSILDGNLFGIKSNSYEIVRLLDIDGDGDKDLFYSSEEDNNYFGRFYGNTQVCQWAYYTDSLQICNGSPITWRDGETYSTDTSGIYFSSMNTASNCYVIRELVVTSVNLTGGISYVNTTTLKSDDAGVNYEWLDCNNNMTPIPGETGQTFSPTSNGRYAVRAYSGNCETTSSCYFISGIGIEELNEESLLLYPNPAQDQIIISHPESVHYHTASIYSTSGELVYQISMDQSRLEHQFNTSQLPNGYYTIQLIGESQITTKAFVVNRL